MKFRMVFTGLCLLLPVVSRLAGQPVRSKPIDIPGIAVPEEEPALFAPEVIRTGMFSRDVAFMPDGTEFYYCVSPGANRLISAIVETRWDGSRWELPRVAPFVDDLRWCFTEPCISPDGSTFFYVTNRPTHDQDTLNDFNVWKMRRAGASWTAPQPLGGPVNSDADEYFPSVTYDGTIYFTREQPDRSNLLMRCRLVNDGYADAEQLPTQVNTGRDRFNAFIAPDESYIIVCSFGRPDTKGSVDYYVVFRDSTDAWSEPVNLGSAVNTRGGQEYSPFVSRDGRYFFFMSSRTDDGLVHSPTPPTYDLLERIHRSPGNGNAAIYWMRADFIEELRPGR